MKILRNSFFFFILHYNFNPHKICTVAKTYFSYCSILSKQYDLFPKNLKFYKQKENKYMRETDKKKERNTNIQTDRDLKRKRETHRDKERKREKE